MSSKDYPAWSRRAAIGALAAAGAGLGVSVWLSRKHRVLIPDGPRLDAPFAPDAFLGVRPDGSITLVTGATEMGQGIHTALGLIVAEALDADWASIHVVTAAENPAFYNPWMKAQRTAASSSVRVWWRPVQEASGRARAMLLAAAARAWNVPVRDCRTESGQVVHPGSARRLTYGALAARAGRLNPHDFEPSPASSGRFVGRGAPRLEALAMGTGRTQYGGDIRLPDMVFASLARSPAVGGEPLHFNEIAARNVPGVVDIRVTRHGIAVIGRNSWAALQGRRALAVVWESPSSGDCDGDALRRRFTALLSDGGHAEVRRGASERKLQAGQGVLQAEYWVPLMAHAAMEPRNCTARVTGDTCDVWVPTQDQTAARAAAVRASGVAHRGVTIHTTSLGGGFGSRVDATVVEEAVTLARESGRAVQLQWTREDDFQHDQYHPCSAHRVRAMLGRDGGIVAWEHRIVGGGADGSTPPYDMANLSIIRQAANPGVATGIWRGVDHFPNAFVVETMIDELAIEARADPLDFRLGLLRPGSPQHRVLIALKESGYWPRGEAAVGAGLAVHEMCDSAVAAVAEVEGDTGATARVTRVTCAVDCGRVINPDGVRAQIEGGIAYGLSAALHGGVSLHGGIVTSTNFDNHGILRMREMPEVRVLVVASQRPPGGIGEVAVPVVVPAVANALFRLRGERLRSLPFPALQPA